MTSHRRLFLKGLTAHAALAGLVSAGLLRPTRVLAADMWPAFGATTLNDALRGIEAAGAAESSEIVLKVPDIAENAAVVPIDVTSNIPGTESISVLVDKNPHPLAARFNFSNGALPQVHLRVKMQQTSNVRVVVKAGGKTWQMFREVKVTLGGCGA